MRKHEKSKARKTGEKIGKKGKEGRKGETLIFHIRVVKRNRNEIEAQKIRF